MKNLLHPFIPLNFEEYFWENVRTRTVVMYNVVNVIKFSSWIYFKGKRMNDLTYCSPRIKKDILIFEDKTNCVSWNRLHRGEINSSSLPYCIFNRVLMYLKWNYLQFGVKYRYIFIFPGLTYILLLRKLLTIIFLMANETCAVF